MGAPPCAPVAPHDFRSLVSPPLLCGGPSPAIAPLPVTRGRRVHTDSPRQQPPLEAHHGPADTSLPDPPHLPDVTFNPGIGHLCGWGGQRRRGGGQGRRGRKEADKTLPVSGQGANRSGSRGQSCGLLTTHSALPLSPPYTLQRPLSPHALATPTPFQISGAPPAASSALRLSFTSHFLHASHKPRPSPHLPPAPNLTHFTHQPSPSSNYNPTEFAHPLNARKQHLLCARQRLKLSWLSKSTVSHRLTSGVGTSRFSPCKVRQRHSKAEQSA